MGNDGLGKKAEQKVKEWLNKPEAGYSFDRLNDQMTGFFGSRNICDFTLYKHPYQYYIECKATHQDRFDYIQLSDTQRNGLFEKSQIDGVFGLVIVLFATYQRAFILDIQDIVANQERDIKSINIKKIDKWKIPYVEIPTIPSRKHLLDYDGEFPELIHQLQINKRNFEG